MVAELMGRSPPRSGAGGAGGGGWSGEQLGLGDGAGSSQQDRGAGGGAVPTKDAIATSPGSGGSEIAGAGSGGTSSCLWAPAWCELSGGAGDTADPLPFCCCSDGLRGSHHLPRAGAGAAARALFALCATGPVSGGHVPVQREKMGSLCLSIHSLC